MSKSLNVPTAGPGSDTPQTKIGKQMTGDDYRESLLTQAKLEKALGTNSRMIPKRPRCSELQMRLSKTSMKWMTQQKKIQWNKMDKKLKYIAVTRSTKLNYLNIE